ncbi:hypothetical protein VB776_06905 [Arcicella sp. DC2W]|uniref:Uncharacterized protein n=1 Tax=Arcicella gelida TaxID=2984195 RepID=A0ABU5S2F2_9BACT|nr:hypothetical protein [Arcicella sp. DC2W]MEA5402636.1 hypothetical protein [Arcicella sp. DC2W]
MKQLAIVEHLQDGSTRISKIIGDGDEEFWQTQFEVAREAIEFQGTISDLEKFNTLHLNLLLSHCIKAGVITKQNINLEPLLMKVVEKEVAKTAWRLSRRKKLMRQFEIQYQQLSGTFQKSVFSRLKSDSFKWLRTFIFKKLPIPFQNLYYNLKQLTK